MSRYRKIDPRIWNDEKFRIFADDSKLAFLFVLTHPQMTAVGAMRGTVAGLAAELGWSEEKMRCALENPISTGMVEIAEQACFLWLPKFLRYNAPESPNVVAGWRQAIQLLPECPLVTVLMTHVEAELAQLGSAFVDSWMHGERPRAGRPSAEVMRQVRERDGDTCRYCETRVSWSDRRGPSGGTYDHVNPRLDSTLDNIVVCCRRCNGKKGLKTPAQAGLKLRPHSKNNRDGSESNLDPTRVQAGNQEQEQEQVTGAVAGDPLGSHASRTASKKPARASNVVPIESDRVVHPIKYLLTVFDQKFTEKFSAPHPQMGAAEAKLAQGILKTYGLDKALIFVEGFFRLNTPWLQEAGYTFRIFNTQLGKLVMHGDNKWLAGLSGKTRANVEACVEAERLLAQAEGGA